MMEEVALGVYKHFKGALVEVIGVAQHSETLERLVVYKKLEEFQEKPKGSMWVRPLAMFLETVERDGKVMKRFEKVE